jgi:hypothetical protein
MNERLRILKEQAEFVDDRYALPDEFAKQFSDLLIKDFYDICNQAWAFNHTEKNKEGISPAEQLVFAGAMAQCQKMKENIREQFGVDE